METKDYTLYSNKKLEEELVVLEKQHEQLKEAVVALYGNNDKKAIMAGINELNAITDAYNTVQAELKGGQGDVKRRRLCNKDRAC